MIIGKGSVWVTDAPKLAREVMVTRSKSSHVYFKERDRPGEFHWETKLFMRFYRPGRQTDTPPGATEKSLS